MVTTPRSSCALAMLALAAALYGVASSPTPDAPGIVEIVILALLAASACAWTMPRDAWARPLLALLVYGATVPLAVGALAGHAATDMLRDLVAFAALAVPFLYAPLFAPGDRRARHVLLAMLLGIGGLFAARYLWAALGDIALLGRAALDHGFLYLANAPLVAFAASWLLLHGCFREPRAWRAIICVIAALLPLAAMLGMMQRATLVLLALAWLGFFAHACIRAPRRAGAVAAALAVTVALTWPLALWIGWALHDKTIAVGWNARGHEWAAILETLADAPLAAIIGTGWGSVLKSPAVGDLWVRFTHGLAPSLLWKTGLAGLTLAALALGAMLAVARARLRGDIVTLTALILPLLPAVFLYGSYKSFCFGLLLLGVARLGGDSTNRPQG